MSDKLYKIEYFEPIRRELSKNEAPRSQSMYPPGRIKSEPKFLLISSKTMTLKNYNSLVLNNIKLKSELFEWMLLLI